ncbi:methyltransferase domain-containing protein [Nocardioides sp.]|uniref:methyltransferase domain-containing protein n=1 Tax=Nocardioides sp. TaxID=35761 RepID=UPI0026159CDC|nr:methyltransferase domain-containing protein [Nocardioides sp.]
MSASRGTARSVVVWEALEPLLGQDPLDVLDIGGGTGGFAVRVASQGHRVTVIDPSPDALAALDRRAREVGVEVASQQGDLTALDVAPGSVDLVLCHGVLEMVADPAAALRSLHEVLRPGGTLSLVVAQRNAAVVARAMAGNFADALALLDSTETTGRTGRRFTVAEVSDLAAEAGFTVASVHGNRVFTDLIPGSILDADAGSSAALADLERAVAARPDFLPLAAQLHVLATRD